MDVGRLRALMAKELRVRMRGHAVFLLQNAYLLLLCVALGGVLLVESEKPTWEIGAEFFRTVMYVQAIALVLLAPAMLGSAVSLEREQRTYVLLRAAPISPGTIVLAKLCACLTPAFLIGVASLPVVSVALILGGVSPSQIVAAYAVTAAGTLLSGSLGLFVSTALQRSVTAIPLALGVCLVATILSTSVALAMITVPSTMNPIVALWGIVGTTRVPFLGSLWPTWIPSLLLCGTGTLFLLLLTRSLLVAPGLRDVSSHRLAGLSVLLLIVGGHVGSLCVQPGLEPAEAYSATTMIVGVASLAIFPLMLWLGAHRTTAHPVEDPRIHRGALRRLVRRDLVFAAVTVLLLAAIASAGFYSLASAPSDVSWQLAPGAIPALDGCPVTLSVAQRSVILFVGIAIEGLIFAVLAKLVAGIRLLRGGWSPLVVAVLVSLAIGLIHPAVHLVWGPGEGGRSATDLEGILEPIPIPIRISSLLETTGETLLQPASLVKDTRSLWRSQRAAPDPWLAIAFNVLILALLLRLRRRQTRPVAV